MTQRTWTDLARALARLRAQLVIHASEAKNDNARRAHLERIVGVDLATRTICKTLRAKSSRFDGRKFMRLSRG